MRIFGFTMIMLTLTLVALKVLDVIGLHWGLIVLPVLIYFSIPATLGLALLYIILRHG